MNNELFIKQYQNIYNSLKYFEISNNKLILKLQTTYIIPFNHINLSNLNPQIFLLDPIELFQTLYILELFYKQTLNDQEINFIILFVNKYLQLDNLRLSNQIDDEKRIYSLGFPIYLADNINFENTACANIIHETINKYLDSGKGKGMRLVLKNPEFSGEFEEDDPLRYLEKAGFTALFLIIGTIAITILYIAFFILNH